MRRQTNLRRETKLFREYARQAFVDTLTLYLHGHLLRHRRGAAARANCPAAIFASG